MSKLKYTFIIKQSIQRKLHFPRNLRIEEIKCIF